MRLELGMDLTRCAVRGAVDHIGLGQPLVDIAPTERKRGEDVLVRVHDPAILAAVVHMSRTGEQRFLCGHDGWQDLPLNLYLAAALLRSGDGLGHDGDHALALEPGDLVEHEGVGCIDEVVLVQGGRVAPIGGVLPGEHAEDTRDGLRLRRVDAECTGMGMRRAHDLQMRDPGRHLGHRVSHSSGDDAASLDGTDTRTDFLARRDIRLHMRHPLDGVVDGAEARAATQASSQGSREIFALLLRERGRGHDHSRRAESALESRGLEELLLHGVE